MESARVNEKRGKAGSKEKLLCYLHPKYSHRGRNYHVALTPPAALCTKPGKSEISMKDKEQDLARGGTNNTRHKQEDAASRDYEKQRAAATKETEAKTKKAQKPGK
jgi:hypothetical protein